MKRTIPALVITLLAVGIVAALIVHNNGAPNPVVQSGHDAGQEYLHKGEEAEKQKAYDAAMQWYRKAADQGNADAQIGIGRLYEQGWGVRKDYDEAWRWYRKAADQGNANAQVSIGLLYENGWGMPKDYDDAMRWFRKAADQGDAGAQFIIGGLYETGSGVPKDYGEAMRWYRKAADQGNASAQDSLGALYQNGLGAPKDYSEAMRWYRKAADQGNADGQTALGRLYAFGWGVPADGNEARKWYAKASTQAAHPAGDTNVNHEAMLQESAKCEGNDPDARIEGCTALINSGYETKQNLPAVYYDRGRAYGNKKLFAKAIADFDQAIELNPQYAAAYYNRGKAKEKAGDSSGRDADLAQAKALGFTGSH